MRFALELHNLSKVYTKKDGSTYTAVDNITLEVPVGQVIGFLGPNGAGKTTTIKMICDIITPSRGTVKLHNLTFKKNRNKALASIGVVLEGARNVYWQLTGWQNLMYFGHLKNVETKRLKKHAEYLLNTLQLWDVKDIPVSDLSRGTQQKVAITCALIHDPSILLLDEPTLGLDVKASRTIKQWIADLAKIHSKTVVLTTHQLDIAEQLCERIVIINKGKIIADQPMHELLETVSDTHYQIAVAGDVKGSGLILHGMEMVEKEDHTLFTGAILTQEDLYQKLSQIHDLKLPLISVTRTKNNLEEVFMQLTHKGDI